MRRAAPWLAALVVFAAAPAAAEALTPPAGAAAIVEPGQTVRVRSTALRREVRVVVRLPREGDASRSPLAVVLAPPEEVALAYAAVTQRQLTSANYGAIVVSVEDSAAPAGPADDQAVEAHLGALYEPDGAQAKAFERFVVDELLPFLQARWPNRDLMLAGSGAGGLFVLRMAAQRPDMADRHFAVGVDPAPGQVDALLAGGREHPEGHAGDVTFVYDLQNAEDPAGLARLARWLQENGHGTDGLPEGDEGPRDRALRIGDWIAAATMVPPT